MTRIHSPDWDGGQLNESFPREVNWDEFGVCTGSCHYNCVFDGAAVFVAEQVEHPDFDFMIRKSASLRRVEGGMADVVINFFGVEASLQGSKYSLQATTSLQPIETHPKFHEEIGGYGTEQDKSHAKNGAIFDKVGKFVGFGPLKSGSSVIENPYLGVRSYYQPSVLFEENSVCGEDHVEVALDNLGKISGPPTTPMLPDVTALDGYETMDRTWLFMGVNAKEMGKGIQRQRRWMLSGFRGWNTVIYGDSAAPGVQVSGAQL